MDKIFGVIRHVLSAAGGLFATLGIINQGDVSGLVNSVDGIVGGVAFLLAIGFSIASKIDSSIKEPQFVKNLEDATKK